MKKQAIPSIILYILIFLPSTLIGQSDYDQLIDKDFKKTLLLHKEFISIPNLPANPDLMLKNINWVADQYEALDFKTELLPSSTLPILIVEKEYNPELKTVLFYFHIDGQPINPEAWNQDHPFEPVLKEKGEQGDWQIIDWNKLDGPLDDDWRMFARAAADDKAPITMLLTAFKILNIKKESPKFNVKIIFDPEEEYGSDALLSTLEKYKARYESDYFIVMDGPAHSSNKPTLTFGCRGIASCEITTYGSRLPQHSGHYGNYVPNPVFRLSKILASMKDDQGRVLIKDYYKGIDINPEVSELLAAAPFDSVSLNKALGIKSAEKVGSNYQEALQYPSLNVRQIGTSWKGKGLKTIIPEYATANLDVRLVPETDGKVQLEKIKEHIKQLGYYVTDKDPTAEERQEYAKIVKFTGSPGINSFRTSPLSAFGMDLRTQLSKDFGDDPVVVIRIMGGTVPIVPLINNLDVPTVIIPMVNMDNNQHNPNENIRIGNIRQGIKICLSVLDTEL